MPKERPKSGPCAVLVVSKASYTKQQYPQYGMPYSASFCNTFNAMLRPCWWHNISKSKIALPSLQNSEFCKCVQYILYGFETRISREKYCNTLQIVACPADGIAILEMGILSHQHGPGPASRDTCHARRHSARNTHQQSRAAQHTHICFRNAF